MKKILLFLSLVITQKTLAQQLVLTGSIQPVKPVTLNDSYDGNYWKNTAVSVSPNALGQFRKTFAGTGSRWLWVGDEAHRKWVLLSPGRPLRIILQNDTLLFRGAAQRENELIATLGLESAQQLPFIQELETRPSYADAPIDSVIRYKLPQILQMLDTAQQRVHHAGLPVAIEKTIQTELKYYYANAIAHDLTYWLNQGSNRRGFHLRFIDTVQAHFPVPTKTELAVSPAANAYLDRLFRFRFWKAFYVYQMDNDKTHADSLFLKTTGSSTAALLSEARNGNEVLATVKHLGGLLPAYAWERQANNVLFRFCMSGQVQDAAHLLQLIQKNSSDQQMVRAAEVMYAPLKKAREQYANDPDIRIRQDYKSISSMEALLAPYKGKVVFIDLWGTWCPYCIRDMTYEPALKAQLAGKEVVYLYIAQDEEKDDAKWRDFIFVNKVTGEHVRKNAEEIGLVWNALGVARENRTYPRYVIVDRSGKIVVNDAKRPGDGDALYQQLLAVLQQ